MYKLNDILLSTYGIIPTRVSGEGIAIKGIFDLPKRHGDTHYSWDESNSVEPYVAAEELFYSGRDILFQGIILGDKATVTTNLNNLKTAINAFNSTVPLETPYGNACVYITDIKVKDYNGGASLLIEFREPVVGASCGINVEDTIYYSEEYLATADKNDCPSGYHGSTVGLTATAGMFTSTISQAAANLLAVNWVLENVQAYANAQGTCIINPPVYYNVQKTAQLQKNDCASGSTGSMVTYVVEAFTYSSEISQEDADAQADADILANFDQAYANANGYCTADPPTGFSTFVMIENYTGIPLNRIRRQRFEVGESIRVGSVFSLTCFGVTVSHTAIGADTPASIVLALKNIINSTTASEWNANDQAPPESTIFFPPEASTEGSNILKVIINRNWQFYHNVTNP